MTTRDESSSSSSVSPSQEQEAEIARLKASEQHLMTVVNEYQNAANENFELRTSLSRAEASLAALKKELVMWREMAAADHCSRHPEAERLKGCVECVGDEIAKSRLRADVAEVSLASAREKVTEIVSNVDTPIYSHNDKCECEWCHTEWQKPNWKIDPQPPLFGHPKNG